MKAHSLLGGDTLSRLVDRDAFAAIIGANFIEVGALWGFDTDPSEWRLCEAHAFWVSDIEHAPLPPVTRTIERADLFKHASYIAFWLRRFIPIDALYHEGHLVTPATVVRLPENQKNYARYCNEVCAIHVGYQLFLGAVWNEMRQSAVPVFRPESWRLPEELQLEAALVLKRKNISPQALYLFYSSFFSQRTGAAAA